MNASINGILFTKADRINSRIDEMKKVFYNMDHIATKNDISKKDFEDFLRTVRLIVTTELTEKGVERKWKE